MPIFLIFNTELEAHNADIQITSNMELSEGSNWANARLTLLNKWVMPKPEDRFMDGVVGYTEEEYTPTWFPPVEDV